MITNQKMTTFTTLLTGVTYLLGASGSIPRSIFAIRSWCFSTIAVIAIAPPTMTATIGTSVNFAYDLGRTTCDAIPGGADRDRTGGLLVANQALSQLSYSPISAVSTWHLAFSQTGQVPIAKY